MPYKCHRCLSLFRKEVEVKRHSLEWCNSSYSWTDDIPEGTCEGCLMEDLELLSCKVELEGFPYSADFMLCAECLTRLGRKLGVEND